MTNTSLGAAKKAKNDEFYTMYQDIENELKYYRKHFAGKTVYCNCDDGVMSNFFKYFMLNFKFLGLERLIATSYGGPVSDERVVKYAECLGDEYVTLSDETKRKFASDSQLRFEYIGESDNANMPRWSSVIVTELEGDGDFRSEESIEFLKESDIVVTNPPFSLFREYVAQLVEYDKKFLIVGNFNAITYKEIFPLIKENKMWVGYSPRSMSFRLPDGSKKQVNSCWFTNIEHGKRHEWLDLDTMERNQTKRNARKVIRERGYPHYDNYDAIEVSFTEAIPSDWDGVMGVPITFLDKYNPEQFEIVGRGEDIEWAQSDECFFFTPTTPELQKLYRQRDKTWRIQNPYLLDEDGYAHTVFKRIFIRNRKPEVSER